MMRITAKDVAELAGVDASAVSRVLNQALENHKYSPATIEKIREAAKKLNYKPSKTARALRTGKSMLIGIVVSDIANPFFAELASHIEKLAWENGYCVVISSTNDDPKRQDRQIDDLISRGIDSLIVAPTIGSKLSGFKRLVAIDRPAEKKDVPYVGLDNHKAGRMLGKQLTLRGYHKIGIIMPDCKTDPTLKYRFEGISNGLATPKHIEWSIEVPSRLNEIRDAVIKKLQHSDKPDAIIGLTNWCTLGALQALTELNIIWGKDIGLAGVDDFSAATLLKPSITVIAQPIEKIAQKAFSLLINQMNMTNSNNQTVTCLIDPIWKERCSLPQK